MRTIRTPITLKEALGRMMEYAVDGGVESIPLEQAYGHVLGEDLVASYDVPRFHRSPYDGFALHAGDTRGANQEEPVRLHVIDEIAAGEIFAENVGPYEAVRIMTGAPIPDGCDGVIPLELVREVEKGKEKYILVKRPLQPGDNISFKGEDITQGSLLVKRGAYIHPGIMALLSTFGYQKVPISRKPRVGIIATGSELLEVDEPLQPGKIRNSNGHMLQAQIQRAGGNPLYFGQLKDDFLTCFRKVEEALGQVDFLVTTGGVSVGDYDYFPAIFEKLEARVLFNKVGIRPGSVTTIAEKDGKLIVGLSGNPSACYVGFELFARPLIGAFLGSTAPFLKKEIAFLASDFPKPNPFDRFVRGYIQFSEGRLEAVPHGLDKSGAISSLARTNALIVLPGGTRGYTKGMEVKVLLLEEQIGSTFADFIR